jgi:hypothetical protein
VLDDGVTVVPEILRGDVSFPRDGYEDFIVVHSDGGESFPLKSGKSSVVESDGRPR